MRWKRTIFCGGITNIFGRENIGVFVRNCHHAMVDSQLLNCVVEPKACAEDLFCGGWVFEKAKCVLLVN